MESIKKCKKRNYTSYIDKYKSTIQLYVIYFVKIFILQVPPGYVLILLHFKTLILFPLKDRVSPVSFQLL